MRGYLLVNFGGPRSLKEVEPFLQALLNDEDVIRKVLWRPLHKWLFTSIARKRAKKVIHDYQLIGGKSPIYEETENLAEALSKIIRAPVFTFHRYLLSTHEVTLRLIEKAPLSEIVVFPLFPQFSYTTTGSTARFLEKCLSKNSLSKLKWVKSYFHHEAFISLWQKIIAEFLEKNGLHEKECFFLFSAHGLPLQYIEEGDPYQSECEECVKKVVSFFPKVEHLLCYQSQFGKAKWIEPATANVCETMQHRAKERKKIVFIPISFTSDHIETLFEIENTYMPLVAKNGYTPYRVSCCYAHNDFPKTIGKILEEFSFDTTSSLVRK